MPVARRSPSGPPIFSDQDDEDIYSFSEDWEMVSSGTINTAGILLPGGSGNWYAQAIAGSSGNQSIGQGSPQLDNPGILRMLTSSTQNDGIAIKRAAANSSSTPFMRSEKIDVFTAFVAIPTITSVRVEIGIDGGIEVPVTQGEGALFIFDSAAAAPLNTRWQVQAARNSQVLGAATNKQLTASSLTVSQWWKLQVQQPSFALWRFLINDEVVAELDRSTVTGQPIGVNVGALCRTLTSASRDLLIDLISLRSKPLQRVTLS